MYCSLSLAVQIEPGVLFYPLDGLDELMTYQFELVAVNIAGESDASRMTFTMPGSGRNWLRTVTQRTAEHDGIMIIIMLVCTVHCVQHAVRNMDTMCNI